jgi:hypothetical protein
MAAGITTSGSIAEELEPGLMGVMGAHFKTQPTFFDSMLQVGDYDRAVAHILEANYFSVAATKTQGKPMATDTYVEGRKKNITFNTVALAAEVTWEALEDEQYGQLKKFGRELAKSIREKIEIDGHKPYTDGFSAETAVDTLSVFNTAHVNLKNGTTWSNRSAADFSYAAAQQVITDFMNLLDGTGKHIVLRPEMFYFPPESWVVAEEILGSAKGEPYSTDNTKNVMYGKMAWKVDPFITDTDSWFARAGIGDLDAHFLWRAHPMMDSWDDKKSRVSTFATLARYGYGVGDPHGMYGSPGA